MNKNTSIDQLDFKIVKAGEFYWGTEWNKDLFQSLSNKYNIPIDWLVKELPGQKIYLDEFAITSIPITVGMMREFYLENSSLKIPKEISQNIDKGLLQLPAYPIDFTLALVFCDWLSLKTNELIDLPTETEWEKSSKGVAQRMFPWGELANNKIANVKGSFGTKPINVMDISENRSPYEIYDLAGNVEEWTRSYNRPYKGSLIKYSSELSYPILRGGTCEHGLDLARCSRRHGNHPSLYRGFRVVKRKSNLNIKSTFYEEVNTVKEGDLFLAKIMDITHEKIKLHLKNNTYTYLHVKDIPPRDLKMYKSFKNKDSELLVEITQVNENDISSRRLTVDELDRVLT